MEPSVETDGPVGGISHSNQNTYSQIWPLARFSHAAVGEPMLMWLWFLLDHPKAQAFPSISLSHKHTQGCGMGWETDSNAAEEEDSGILAMWLNCLVFFGPTPRDRFHYTWKAAPASESFEPHGQSHNALYFLNE